MYPFGPIGDVDVDPVASGLLGQVLKLALDFPAFLVVAQVVEDGHQVDVAVLGLLFAGHRPEQHHARRPALQDRSRGPLGVGHRGGSQGCGHSCRVPILHAHSKQLYIIFR